MSALESLLITQSSELWSESPSTGQGSNRIAQRLSSGELVRIMGPCSLLSAEQLQAMLPVIRDNVDLVRAPGKKPRTRPVSPSGQVLFEGIGMSKAAQIYQEIQPEYPDVLFASEVMSDVDVQTIAPYLGLAWIGSRTQQQETCRSIGKQARESKLPVMVKNPLVNDLPTFWGMMENAIFGAECVLPLLVCLRGTSPVNGDEKQWRNTPNLHWIEELRRYFSQLPIIIDPSHMLLKNQLTPENVVQLIEEGIDQGANGYIVELNTPDHPSITDPGTDAEATLNLLVQRNLA